MKKRVTDYTLYKWRYHIGYSFLALLVAGILSVALFYVPGALRQGEMNSALASGALSINSIEPQTVADLPYHLLQRISFVFFDVSTFSIKLPSVILAAFTAFGIFLLINIWFRRNIAIIVTAIAVTTPQFLFLAQDGTPSITFSFVAVWLLVACTYMTRAKYFKTFWKVIMCVLTAIAFYIPLGIYLVIALAITASLHPHIRHMIRKIAKVRLAIAIALGIVAIIPLIQAVIIDHTVALTLLGIPSSGINLQENVVTVGQDLFGFFLASDNYLLRPLYSLAAIILMGVGTYKFLTVNYTARSYTLFIMAFFIIPLIVINPSHISDLYVLAVLVIAMGIKTLVDNWYKLFPRNPYARIAGLLPISIFIVGMVFTGMGRYTSNYTYNANVLDSYSNDLKLLTRAVASNASDNTTIVLATTAQEEPFYQLVARYDKRFTVNDATDETKVTIVTHQQHAASPLSKDIHTIITNRKAANADRFYIYKLSDK